MEIIITTVSGLILLLLSLLAGYIGFKRADGLKNKGIIAFILFFIVLFFMAILMSSGLSGYVQILAGGKESVNITGISIILILTAIYIELTLITDDLIKNIDILISLFKK